MAVKRHRGGKYSNVTFANGDFGRNDAGTAREARPNTAGQSREMGHGDGTYTFYSKSRGYLTVHAESFEEAWRQARLLGYSKRNYRKR